MFVDFLTWYIGPPIVFITECRVVTNIWKCSPISFNHASLWCWLLILTEPHTNQIWGSIMKMSHLRPIHLRGAIQYNIGTTPPRPLSHWTLIEWCITNSTVPNTTAMRATHVNLSHDLPSPFIDCNHLMKHEPNKNHEANDYMHDLELLVILH